MTEVVRGQGFGPAAPFLVDGALGGPIDGVVERVVDYVRAGLMRSTSRCVPRGTRPCSMPTSSCCPPSGALSAG